MGRVSGKPHKDDNTGFLLYQLICLSGKTFFFKPITFLGIKQKLKLNQKNTSNISIKTINTVNNIILNNIILDAF